MGCKASKTEFAVEEAAPHSLQHSGNKGKLDPNPVAINADAPATKVNRSPKTEESKAKAKPPVVTMNGAPNKTQPSQGHNSPSINTNSLKEGDKQAAVYNLLVKAQELESRPHDMANRILAVCGSNPSTASYIHPATKSTPLHLAVQLLDNKTRGAPFSGADIVSLVEGLVQAHPDAMQIKDLSGNIPLHYAIAPSEITTYDPSKGAKEAAESWGPRSAVLQILLTADFDFSMTYLTRNDVVYGKIPSGGATPLYRAIQALPDDFEPFSVTYEFISILRDACGEMVGVGNKGDGDKPLSLLYRRFTRQFDLAEKFFEGDNSRKEVMEHRLRYKTAAANTWKIIECLLRPDTAPDTPSASSPLRQNSRSAVTAGQEWRLVHRAVQVETPPDLLRYIVETNAEDLTKPDSEGNLPLHYAASSKPSDRATETAFPSFYTKYVVDELLYKFPEAAGMADAHGKYPLTLAVEAGKHWIGGGIKSLYDAFPTALEQIKLEDHQILRRVLSDDASNFLGEEKISDSVIRDEHHDAIMLVQQEDVEIAEVVTSMWAHEEDAGVQMLACVAVARLVEKLGRKNPEYLLRIALLAVAAVVNAMKAHPNEVIIQEKACKALKEMAGTDGQQEISFVASGAVAAIVGAMQAHVSDPCVQEEACGAIAAIIQSGGPDRATIVASVSGFTAIVNALAAHPDAVGVQKNACLALDAMTSFSDANLPELPRTQTEPLLEAARYNFPRECGATAERVMARLV